MVTIRPLNDNDFDTVDVIQHLAYPPGLAETQEVLKSKRRAAPDFCFLACANGAAVGYVIAHPWLRDKSPGLERSIDVLPPECDVVHLHDLVVHPDSHGQGIARALVDAVVQHAMDAAFDEITLVAVMDAQSFWQKMGFQTVRSVQGYDDHAVFMRRVLRAR
ncbi:MAG: GNAT family N-acetyltransferase [bacterium]